MLPYPDPDPDTELNATGQEVPIGYFWALAVIFAVGVIAILAFWIASRIPVKASWYSNEDSGPITANGERFQDHKMTAASWDYPFNQCLTIQNQANEKTVTVRINDRGPSRKLYKKGRKLDMSLGAFSRIADPREGIIKVTIIKTNQEHCHDKKTSQ